MSSEKKIKVIIGKVSLDGHDRGAKVVARFLMDAGMEVIYLGAFNTPEKVVDAAMQEDVDLVGLSSLSGAHMHLFTEVLRELRENGLGDIQFTSFFVPNKPMEFIWGIGPVLRFPTEDRLFLPVRLFSELGHPVKRLAAPTVHQKTLNLFVSARYSHTPPAARIRGHPTVAAPT